MGGEGRGERILYTFFFLREKGFAPFITIEESEREKSKPERAPRNEGKRGERICAF